MYISPEELEEMACYIGHDCSYTIEEFDGYLCISFNVTVNSGKKYQLGKQYSLLALAKGGYDLKFDLLISVEEFKEYICHEKEY